MNDWSVINQKLQEEDQKGLLALLPFDGGASVFPQKDLPIFPELVHIRENNVVCKRFVFQPSMIKLLKAMVNSSSVDLAPTRVQLVMAWIYKRAVSIMGLDFKTALFTMAVDLRKRMVPPLSEKCVGNIVWISSMFADKEEMELEDLVCKIKEGLSECCDVYPKMFGRKEKEDFSMISECLKQVTGPLFENENLFHFSSWCKFPMYEADFGWGKPTWVTTFGCSSRKVILLMDTRDGDGIEAVLNMEENDMAKFEHDVELLQNASLKSY
jgi:shikimate O-hydroxycinnamoyltransferase